jgi:hypothetical protein
LRALYRNKSSSPPLTSDVWQLYKTHGFQDELKEFYDALIAANAWSKEAKHTEAECTVRLRELEALRAGILARYMLYEQQAGAIAEITSTVNFYSDRQCPSSRAGTSLSDKLVADYSRWEQMSKYTTFWLTEGKKNDSIAKTITAESIDAQHRKLKDLAKYLFDEEH